MLKFIENQNVEINGNKFDVELFENSRGTFEIRVLNTPLGLPDRISVVGLMYAGIQFNDVLVRNPRSGTYSLDWM